MMKQPNGTTEEALFILFMRGCRAYRGLDVFLTSEEFKIPFSLFYGEFDWMKALNNGLSEKIIRDKNSSEYQYHIIPQSNHNMFSENPDALSCSIINDIFDLRMAVLSSAEYE